MGTSPREGGFLKCPDCQTKMHPTEYRGVRIDECPRCRGRWFDRDELRQAKDRTDDDLRWLDFDPFSQKAVSLGVASEERICPRCSVTMGSISYQASGVAIDKCNACHGIWLDHDEFEKIVKYLMKVMTSETASQYVRDAGKQFAEIVTGPEGVISEIRDFLAVLRLLEMRLAVEHPQIGEIANTIYSIAPIK
jgi:Zn-finger nucleic acid-binding protein